MINILSHIQLEYYAENCTTIDKTLYILWDYMSAPSLDSLNWDYWEIQPPSLPLPSPSTVVWAIVVGLILRFLHILSACEAPKVTLKEKSKNGHMKQLINGITMLAQPYCPPSLWGRSGHIQTAAYGLLGHASLKRTYDQRVGIRLADGSTQTFDIFLPIVPHSSGKDVTLVLTPGIANSSESNYIRTCVHFAQENGYRCVVLNHMGALPDVKLTGNKIFSYGRTDEITAMMDWLMKEFPETKFINIGFSMGANIITKYLIQLDESKRNRFLMGLSVCMGYSATNSVKLYHDWENNRRAYNYIITENMKRLLRRNYDNAVGPYIADGIIDEQKLWAATSILSFDEHYSRRVHGFDSVESFYEWVDCLPHIPKLQIPMIFLNAEDDPLVPQSLWQPVKEMASNHELLCFILTSHGGHLGFLEGGSLSPLSITWIDRFIVQMANAAIDTFSD
ncbi:hypothetical protein WR25_14433 [Diploscapter pachys]|uniref:AB hydrolase-1 domain-containing protein n=1 Tax=Diploscapter pachys TaxID=2018661 RepID=A0A2A2JG84_9BILA|nr:hypothetical protein WR25_14433 [Diploscapter pachys]